MTKPHHFEVEGPGRDYDYATFCRECHADAIDFANEWLADLFDALDVGEDAAVTVRVVEGEMQPEEECIGYSCKPDKKDGAQ